MCKLSSVNYARYIDKCTLYIMVAVRFDKKLIEFGDRLYMNRGSELFINYRTAFSIHFETIKNPTKSAKLTTKTRDLVLFRRYFLEEFSEELF